MSDETDWRDGRFSNGKDGRVGSVGFGRDERVCK